MTPSRKPPRHRSAPTGDVWSLSFVCVASGVEPLEEGSGGAVDASLSAGVGRPTLDGFGIVGGNIHTPEEYAEVESVAPRIYLLSRMIMELAKQ